MRITLATLPKATAQQVFDQVAEHLLTQGTESMQSGRCMYKRGNMSCAAGCLIAESEYDREKMETFNWHSLVTAGVVPGDHEDLIADLQIVHDTKPPRSWRDCLAVVARDHNLRLN